MIFISAGHNNSDPGAMANGVREADLTKDLRDLVTINLRARGITYVQDRDEESLKQYLSRIQPGTGSVVCEIHFNASQNDSAEGLEVLIPDDYSKENYNMATLMATRLCLGSGLKNRGVKTESQSHRGKLGLMRKQGIKLLIEVCFITNVNDLTKYQHHRDEIAEYIAQTLIEADRLLN